MTDELITADDYVNSQEFKDKFQAEIDRMKGREEAVRLRVEKMKPIFEGLIFVEKIDVLSLKSFLAVSDQTKYSQVRESFYARIIKINDLDTGDFVREQKRAMLEVGDIINFNPEAAYSLNIKIPEEFPEIWAISVENVIMVDKGFDVEAARIQTLQTKLIIEKMQEIQMKRKMEAAHKELAVHGGEFQGGGKNTIGPTIIVKDSDRRVPRYR